MEHSGSQWVKSSLKVEQLSPLGAAVADLLGDVFCGIYHLDIKKLKKVDWGNPHFIAVQLPWRTLSTYDNPELTWLVVLCHDRCLRLEISAVTVKTLQLMFHQRQRDGRLDQRMPTIEGQIEHIRKYHPIGS